MKDYMKELNKTQAAKEAAIAEISKELQRITLEIERESRKSIDAVNEGNRKAFTTAKVQIEYLQQRQAVLIRQRDEKAAEPVWNKGAFMAAQNEMLQETEPIRSGMLTQLFKDWQTMIDHFSETKATLEKYNTECRKMAKLAGDESIIDMTGRSGEIREWISSVERSPRFAQLKLLAEKAAK